MDDYPYESMIGVKGLHTEEEKQEYRRDLFAGVWETRTRKQVEAGESSEEKLKEWFIGNTRAEMEETRNNYNDFFIQECLFPLLFDNDEDVDPVEFTTKDWIVNMICSLLVRSGHYPSAHKAHLSYELWLRKGWEGAADWVTWSFVMIYCDNPFEFDLGEAGAFFDDFYVNDWKWQGKKKNIQQGQMSLF